MAALLTEICRVIPLPRIRRAVAPDGHVCRRDSVNSTKTLTIRRILEIDLENFGVEVVRTKHGLLLTAQNSAPVRLLNTLE